MKTTYDANVTWIGKECGGREIPPVAGMRENVRLQHHIDVWLKGGSSIQLVHVETDPVTLRGRCHFWLLFPGRLEPFIEPGTLFEVLEGDRVVGVGKVTGLSVK